MPWPGGLSQRASTPASEPSQDPRPPPHKGFGFAGDRPREQDRRMVSAPLSFRGISAGRVSPLLPIRVSFPKLSLVSRLQCVLILSFLVLSHQPSCLFSPSFHSHSPPPLRVPPSLFPTLIIPSPGRYTYEIAPVFVLMEEEVLKKLRALVGWSSGDGVFCPGM